MCLPPPPAQEQLEGKNQVSIIGSLIPGRGNSRCKGPEAGMLLACWSTISVSKQRAVRRITGELKKWALARSHEALQTMKISLTFIPVAEEFTGRCLL